MSTSIPWIIKRDADVDTLVWLWRAAGTSSLFVTPISCHVPLDSCFCENKLALSHGTVLGMTAGRKRKAMPLGFPSRYALPTEKSLIIPSEFARSNCHHPSRPGEVSGTPNMPLMMSDLLLATDQSRTSSSMPFKYELSILAPYPISISSTDVQSR